MMTKLHRKYDARLHPKLRQQDPTFIDQHYYQAERTLMNVHFNGGYKFHSKYQGLAKALVKICGGLANGGDKMKDAIKLFLRSALAANGEGFIVVMGGNKFLEKSKFPKPTTPPTFAQWTNFLQIMVDQGYGTLYLGDSRIETTDAYINNGNRMKSIFLPSEMLGELIEMHQPVTPVLVPTAPPIIYRLGGVECIQETTDGHAVTITAPGVKSYTEEVQSYNVYMYGQSICDENGVRIDTYACRRFKIKADDPKKDVLKSNGRFISSYMQTPHHQRSKFSINGESVVEADYSSCHFRIMYEKAGATLPKEFKVYDLESSPLDAPELTKKWFYKLAMMVLANSQTPTRTLSRKVSEAFKKIAEWEAGRSLPKELQLFSSFNTQPTTSNCKEVLEQLLKRNPRITHELTGKAAAGMMNIESNIAMKVMTRLTKQDIPVLCMHDSFIVPESKGAELVEAMKNAWRDVLGSSECVAIDWK